MNKITFQFYSVLKNEDANPYIGGNILVAADGLGGSGSAVHNIDRAQHDDLYRDMISSAFGDMKVTSMELTKYIEELIAPMVDGKDDTSALWASRIVIARCAYALTEGAWKDADLSDEKVREGLTEFIKAGLHETAQKFHLQNGKYDGQLLLPTTLAFMRYSETENTVIVETLWAGDSRCYALTMDGLKLLSIDDEDQSGTINNLFYADNEKVKLNYLRHELAKPCALLAVSDGIFDPLVPQEHLGVEHTLLSAIKNHHTLQEVQEYLYHFYENVHADDATMAFVAFGFDSYEDMQKKLAKRTEEILPVRKKQGELYGALEVMNQTEEEASHYVFSRTNDRFDYIVPMLVEVLESGASDIALTPEVHKIVENVKRDCKIAAKKERKQKEGQALDALNNYVKTHPEFVSKIFVSEQKIDFKEDDAITGAYSNLWENALEYMKSVVNIEKLKVKEIELRAKSELLHQRVMERINFYHQQFVSLWEDKNPDYKLRNNARIYLKTWYDIDFNLQYICGVFNIESLPVEDRFLVREVRDHVDEYRKVKRQMKKMKSDSNRSNNYFLAAWNIVYRYFKRCSAVIKYFLTPEAMEQFEFDEIEKSGISELGKGKRDRILSELKAQKEGIISSIVKSLAEHYDQNSIIDKQYNATKLELFRIYFRLKASGSDEVKALEEKLDTLEKEYISLVTK